MGLRLHVSKRAQSPGSAWAVAQKRRRQRREFALRMVHNPAQSQEVEQQQQYGLEQWQDNNSSTGSSISTSISTSSRSGRKANRGTGQARDWGAEMDAYMESILPALLEKPGMLMNFCEYPQETGAGPASSDQDSDAWFSVGSDVQEYEDLCSLFEAADLHARS